MSTKGAAPAGIVHQLLDNRKNYLDWNVRVKTYLIGQDLWDIVKSTDPERENGVEFKSWTPKNASALSVIQNLCDNYAFSKIKNITSAKKAWNTLEEKFKPQTEHRDKVISDVKANIPKDQIEEYRSFHRAVQNGDKTKAEDFIKQYPDAVKTRLTHAGRTALYEAATAGHFEMVEMLVEKMSPEDLEMRDIRGYTPLAAAIIYNADIKIAKCMVEKNNKILTMLVPHMIPSALAISDNFIEMGRYLYSATAPLEVLKLPENHMPAATLMSQALYMKFYDVALHLLESCPQLATTLDKDDKPPVYALADSPSIFPSGCPLKFWQKWIYESIIIHRERFIKEKYTKLPSKTASSGFKKIYEMKLVHIQILELLRRMCEEITNLDETQLMNSHIYNVFFKAVKKGNLEFVKSILKLSPDLVEARNKNEMNIFMLAIRHRQAKIFSLVHRARSKSAAANDIDDHGNNMLHMAALLSYSHLDRISGAALQMQRELQWFKEVESVVPQWTHGSTDSNFLTPRQLFTKEHKELKSDGEKWMKETATSCTVVGALIVTIMFAATFTVPGGNDETTGFPKFLDDKIFMLFIISDAISLFSSTTAVLMFLGILTSRYGEDDFLESLPKRLIIGLCTLFFSIAAMMISFCAAVFIMLDKKSWVVFPIFSLASIPVTLFVLMQFPLLVEIFRPTYGPSIFN